MFNFHRFFKVAVQLSCYFDYTHYSNRSPGYNTTVFLVTPSVAKQLLKNKAGEIRLSCFDLLNQNAVVSSTPSAGQIIDTRTNTLKRYLMFTFTHNLRNFAGQQQRNQDNNNPVKRRFREGEGGGRPPGGGFGGMRRGGGDN
ncbi:MAG: hypothetical protein NVS3B15_04840 [Sediminibacterium sp.]